MPGSGDRRRSELRRDEAGGRVAYDDWKWWREGPALGSRAYKELERLPGTEPQAKLLRAMQRYKDGESNAQDVTSLGNDLWEIRVRLGNNQFRVLFFHWRTFCVALTCFYKNQQKLEKHDRERAVARMKSWLQDHGN